MRIGTLHTVLAVKKRLFINSRGISEIKIILTGYLGTIQIGVTVTQTAVYESTVIVTPCYLTFGSRSIGYLLGRRILYRCNEYLPAIDKGHLLAIGRYNRT